MPQTVAWDAAAKVGRWFQGDAEADIFRVAEVKPCKLDWLGPR
jgi:hypothetical protein